MRSSQVASARPRKPNASTTCQSAHSHSLLLTIRARSPFIVARDTCAAVYTMDIVKSKIVLLYGDVDAQHVSSRVPSNVDRRRAARFLGDILSICRFTAPTPHRKVYISYAYKPQKPRRCRQLPVSRDTLLFACDRLFAWIGYFI